MGSNHDPKTIPNPISSRRAARAQPRTREGAYAPPPSALPTLYPLPTKVSKLHILSLGVIFFGGWVRFMKPKGIAKRSERGAHAPPRAVSAAPVGNSAGTSGWVRTMIPKRYRTLSPAAGQRGRSPEHARARMLPPVGFADAPAGNSVGDEPYLPLSSFCGL